MFLVANTTGSPIPVNDLNLSLGVKQAIDLHKIKLPKAPEKSGELMSNIKSGAIKVLKQDSKKQKKQKLKKIEAKVTNNYSIDQTELLKSIELLIKNQVPGMVKNELESQNKDNKDLLDAIDGIKHLVKNQKSTVIVQEGASAVNKEDLDLDEETRVQIHKRTVNTMTESAEGNLEYEDQEVTDDTMSNDLDLMNDMF